VLQLALKHGSSNGIDVTDVGMMVSALESLHTTRVVIQITTRGAGHNGGLHIGVDALFNVLPGSDLPKVVSVNADWPSTKARSFLGLMYNLLWQLDYAIQQAYEQMPLPGA
jgi:hypothetical protein